MLFMFPAFIAQLSFCLLLYIYLFPRLCAVLFSVSCPSVEAKYFSLVNIKLYGPVLRTTSDLTQLQLQQKDELTVKKDNDSFIIRFKRMLCHLSGKAMLILFLSLIHHQTVEASSISKLLVINKCQIIMFNNKSRQSSSEIKKLEVCGVSWLTVDTR